MAKDTRAASEVAVISPGVALLRKTESVSSLAFCVRTSSFPSPSRSASVRLAPLPVAKSTGAANDPAPIAPPPWMFR